MIPKYTKEQFNNAKTRDFLDLECEFCHSDFKLIKKIILESIRYPEKHIGRFCSHKCAVIIHKKQLQLFCLQCQKEFTRIPSKLKRSNGKSFCSRQCGNTYLGNLRAKPKPIKLTKVIKQPIKCFNCENLTMNTKFCSGTCRNKVNNLNLKGSKSKAERLLVEQLKLNFPQWTILENNRKILNGLELDVFIPEIRLAIEWNGIFHYEPIHGNHCLERVIKKDTFKIELCKSLGIELIVICDRTSHVKFIRETINTLINNLKIMAGTTDNASV